MLLVISKNLYWRKIMPLTIRTFIISNNRKFRNMTTIRVGWFSSLAIWCGLSFYLAVFIMDTHSWYPAGWGTSMRPSAHPLAVRKLFLDAPLLNSPSFSPAQLGLGLSTSEPMTDQGSGIILDPWTTWGLGTPTSCTAKNSITFYSSQTSLLIVYSWQEA